MKCATSALPVQKMKLNCVMLGLMSIRSTLKWISFSQRVQEDSKWYKTFKTRWKCTTVAGYALCCRAVLFAVRYNLKFYPCLLTWLINSLSSLRANTRVCTEDGSSGWPSSSLRSHLTLGASAASSAKLGLESRSQNCCKDYMRWHMWGCLINSTNIDFCVTFSFCLELKQEYELFSYLPTVEWTAESVTQGRIAHWWSSCLLPPSISTYQKDVDTGAGDIWFTGTWIFWRIKIKDTFFWCNSVCG